MLTIIFVRSLQSLVLHEVGIRELSNDFDEVESLPELTTFSYTNSTLSYMQRKFFSVFPKLKVIRIREVSFMNKRSGFRDFHTEARLEKVELINNDFSHLELGGMPYRILGSSHLHRVLIFFVCSQKRTTRKCPHVHHNGTA